MTDSTDKLLWWSSSRGKIELQMTLEQAESVSHPGDCEADTRALLKDPAIAAQFATFAHADIAAELKETGAWDVEELADEEMSRVRLLWLAGCEVAERAFAGEDDSQ